MKNRLQKTANTVVPHDVKPEIIDVYIQQYLS